MKAFGDGGGVDEIALANLAHDELVDILEQDLLLVFHSFSARVGGWW